MSVYALFHLGIRIDKPSSKFLRRIRNRYNKIAKDYDRGSEAWPAGRLAYERKRQFMAYCLKKYGLMRQGALLLDLGCGTGAYIPFLINGGLRVVGIDLSINMLRIAKQKAPRAEFVLASMYDLPLRTDTFDALIAMGAIQFHFSATHFGIHKPALLEIQRTAKKRAMVIFELNNPIGPLYWRSFPSDILRIRKLAYPWSVIKFLASLRFKVIEVASCILIFFPIYGISLQLKMENYAERIPILRFLGRFLLLCTAVCS